MVVNPDLDGLINSMQANIIILAGKPHIQKLCTSWIGFQEKMIKFSRLTCYKYLTWGIMAIEFL